MQTTVNTFKKKKTLFHKSDTYKGHPLGQNLYVLGGMAPAGDDITKFWHSENKNYNYKFGKSKNDEVIGHFTQLVWKSTTYIRCAYAEGTWSGYKPSYFVWC